MKNVFARTVLALVLIPSFWMTSVGTAAAGWVDRPGETVGKMAACASTVFNGRKGEYECSNPIRVSFTVFGFYQACENAGRYPRDIFIINFSPSMQGKSAHNPMGPSDAKHKGVRYMQFVPDDSVGGNTALSGLCYYYEAGSSSGKSGPYTWRFDY